MQLGENIVSSVIKRKPAPSQIRSLRVGTENRVKGRVRFQIPISFLGGGLRTKLTKELKELSDFSSIGVFYIDMIGQILVRKHFLLFAQIILEMTESQYEERLIRFSHLHFSARQVDRDYIEFVFHVSFLHDMALEIFYQQVTQEDGSRTNGRR